MVNISRLAERMRLYNECTLSLHKGEFILFLHLHYLGMSAVPINIKTVNEEIRSLVRGFDSEENVNSDLVTNALALKVSTVVEFELLGVGLRANVLCNISANKVIRDKKTRVSKILVCSHTLLNARSRTRAYR